MHRTFEESLRATELALCVREIHTENGAQGVGSPRFSVRSLATPTAPVSHTLFFAKEESFVVPSLVYIIAFDINLNSLRRLISVTFERC